MATQNMITVTRVRDRRKNWQCVTYPWDLGNDTAFKDKAMSLWDAWQYPRVENWNYVVMS